MRVSPLSSSLVCASLMVFAAGLAACSSAQESTSTSVDPLGAGADPCAVSRALQRDALDHEDTDTTEDDPIDRGRHTFNDRKLHDLHGNGRSCADCHMHSDAFTLTPAAAKARYDALQACRVKHPDADDPLFRPVDADDFRTNGANATDYTRLTQNALVRFNFPLRPTVKLIDPATNAPSAETSIDVYRAVPSIWNVKITGPDGVLVFAPDGKHLGTINTGEKTANCNWGDDGSMLYITANHFLCRIQTKTKGAKF